MTSSVELKVEGKEFSLEDFERVLPWLIPISNTAVLSDFDETLCSNYSYDIATKTHWPHIDKRILLEARKMRSPLFIATSRSSNELVLQEACASLVAQKGIPIICENGASLFFPESGQTLVLASDDQREQISEIRRGIGDVGVEFKNRELLYKANRSATIEMRIQYLSGTGDPTLYGELALMLGTRFDLTNLDLVSSNNSLSIQPSGINKGTGFLEALKVMELERSSFFVVGLGDAPNDKEIFKEADIGIAVGVAARDFADYFVNGGANVTAKVLERIQ